MSDIPPPDGYPDDWREQGWCCRECAVMAWYGMTVGALPGGAEGRT